MALTAPVKTTCQYAPLDRPRQEVALSRDLVVVCGHVETGIAEARLGDAVYVIRSYDEPMPAAKASAFVFVFVFILIGALVEVPGRRAVGSAGIDVGRGHYEVHLLDADLDELRAKECHHRSKQSGKCTPDAIGP